MKDEKINQPISVPVHSIRRDIQSISSDLTIIYQYGCKDTDRLMVLAKEITRIRTAIKLLRHKALRKSID